MVVSLPLVQMCVHGPQADGRVCWVCGLEWWGTSLEVQWCDDQYEVDICCQAEVGTWCLGERSSVCCSVHQCLAEDAHYWGSPAAGLQCQQGSKPLLHYLQSGWEGSVLRGEAVLPPPHCSVNRAYNSNMCHWKQNSSFPALLFKQYAI